MTRYIIVTTIHAAEFGNVLGYAYYTFVDLGLDKQFFLCSAVPVCLTAQSALNFTPLQNGSFQHHIDFHWKHQSSDNFCRKTIHSHFHRWSMNLGVVERTNIPKHRKASKKIRTRALSMESPIFYR